MRTARGVPLVGREARAVWCRQLTEIHHQLVLLAAIIKHSTESGSRSLLPANSKSCKVRKLSCTFVKCRAITDVSDVLMVLPSCWTASGS